MEASCQISTGSTCHHPFSLVSFICKGYDKPLHDDQETSGLIVLEE